MVWWPAAVAGGRPWPGADDDLLIAGELAVEFFGGDDCHRHVVGHAVEGRAQLPCRLGRDLVVEQFLVLVGHRSVLVMLVIGPLGLPCGDGGGQALTPVVVAGFVVDGPVARAVVAD